VRQKNKKKKKKKEIYYVIPRPTRGKAIQQSLANQIQPLEQAIIAWPNLVYLPNAILA
jgi:hypothetical protein